MGARAQIQKHTATLKYKKASSWIQGKASHVNRWEDKESQYTYLEIELVQKQINWPHKERQQFFSEATASITNKSARRRRIENISVMDYLRQTQWSATSCLWAQYLTEAATSVSNKGEAME